MPPLLRAIALCDPRVRRSPRGRYVGLIILGVSACDGLGAPAHDDSTAPLDSPPLDAGSDFGGDGDDTGSEPPASRTLLDAARSLDSSRLPSPPSDQPSDARAPDAELASNPGPGRTGDFAVGTVRIELAAGRDRRLPVQLWYPAVDEARDEASRGHAVEEFEPEGVRREQLSMLVQAAPEGCANRTMHAALAPAPYAQRAPFPLIASSHHLSGSRFATFTIAEQLARSGFVVAAPDHVGGTIFERTGDLLSDTLSQANAEFFQTRAQDIERVLDALLDVQEDTIPEGIRGRIDPERVGILGHSLGGMSIGITDANDQRVKAAAFLAISPTSELNTLAFDLPEISRFRVPALYMIAEEDAVMVASGGREAIVSNFEDQSPAAWLVAVRDTGHMSFADDCGLAPEFGDGCGTGTRSSDWAEEFTFLDPATAREIAGRYTAAFFASQLLGASSAGLVEASPPELVSVRQRPARTSDP